MSATRKNTHYNCDFFKITCRNKISYNKQKKEGWISEPRLLCMEQKFKALINIHRNPVCCIYPCPVWFPAKWICQEDKSLFLYTAKFTVSQTITKKTTLFGKPDHAKWTMVAPWLINKRLYTTLRLYSAGQSTEVKQFLANTNSFNWHSRNNVENSKTDQVSVILVDTEIGQNQTLGAFQLKVHESSFGSPSRAWRPAVYTATWHAALSGCMKVYLLALP